MYLIKLMRYIVYCLIIFQARGINSMTSCLKQQMSKL